MARRSCIFHTLSILFFIGKLYGMSTFTYIWEDKRKVLVRFCDGVRLVAFLVFYITLLVLNCVWSIESLDDTFTIFNTGIRYLLMYSITMVIFTVIYNFLFRKQLFNIIVKIDDHDAEVGGQHLISYYKLIIYIIDWTGSRYGNPSTISNTPTYCYIVHHLLFHRNLPFVSSMLYLFGSHYSRRFILGNYLLFDHYDYQRIVCCEPGTVPHTSG